MATQILAGTVGTIPTAVDQLLIDLADLADATVDNLDGIDYGAAARVVGAAIDAYGPDAADRAAFIEALARVLVTAALGNALSPA